MNIVIVGCGNVGRALLEHLSKEGHDITLVDNDRNRLEQAVNTYDVMGVEGNGASFETLREAGVEKAHLLIAVTNSDELNLLCCLIAKKTGGCNTIARVRNPIYNKEIGYIKEEIGVSMIINPEFTAAEEMARLLKFPSAITIDTFAKGRVEIIKYRIGADSQLKGLSVKEIAQKFAPGVLICTVERGEEVFIPDGDFVICEKDAVSIIGSPSKTIAFFKKIGVPTTRAKNAMIVGGGEIGYYLATLLTDMGITLKIIEKNEERCKELSELLPKATIIFGDGTDRNLLMEAGITGAEAFVALTDFDEENIMLSMFVKSKSQAKLITHVHRIGYDELINELDIGSVIYPKYITAEHIIKYVRAMGNSLGSGIETLYKLNDKAEALEFIVAPDSPVVGKMLMDLPIKDNILIGIINHRGQIGIAGGRSMISAGDAVIVITTLEGLHDIKDILK